MTAHELLTNLHRQGFNLTPLPGGLLEVRPASRLTPELREELKRRKAEVLNLLTQLQPSSAWPCPHCGTPAEIEAVEPRKDDGVLLTFWHCEPCQTWAVTPSTLREPPVWVSRKEQ
jgi:hypothetical protein